MYYRVLTVNPGLEVEVTGEGLEAQCALRVGQGPWQEVPLEVAALLWWADGQRTVEALHELAQEAGATLSLERVEAHLRQLQAAGWVTLATLDAVEHALLPGTQPHTCEGCGRSCEGHLVGPLPPSEVETIRAALPTLQALEPALAGQTPFMVVARKPGVYLRLVEGRCIFLDEARRCRLHKHLGAAAKPSICRMFPYVRALTEGGYRWAIAPGCFRHHKQALTAPGPPHQAQLASAFDAADVSLLRLSRQARVLLVGPESEQPPSSPSPTTTPTDDQLVLWLGDPGVRLRDLLGWLLDAHADTPSLTTQDADPAPHWVSPEAIGLCASLGARLLPSLEGERSFIGGIARQGGPFAISLRGLIDAIRCASHITQGVALPRRVEVFALDALRRSLFIRDALAFPDTPRAVAALLAGWVIALAAQPQPNTTTAPHLDPDATYDAICELWAAWYRVIPHSGLGARLFAQRADALALLTALRA
jgi:Fe-S-cluster containining protein